MSNIVTLGREATTTSLFLVGEFTLTRALVGNSRPAGPQGECNHDRQGRYLDVGSQDDGKHLRRGLVQYLRRCMKVKG